MSQSDNKVAYMECFGPKERRKSSDLRRHC